MSQPRCETCRHWERHALRDGTFPPLGDCNRIDSAFASDATHITCTDVQGNEQFAYLSTRPDFGCVLWEARE